MKVIVLLIVFLTNVQNDDYCCVHTKRRLSDLGEKITCKNKHTRELVALRKILYISIAH